MNATQRRRPGRPKLPADASESVRFELRMNPKLRDSLRRLASRDGLTVAELIKRLLTQYVADNDA
jgi:hypothetical protein